MRDFLSILQSHKYFRDSNWNKTESTYTFETGSKIEFFSADQPDKVRGPRRDRLFINEANNVDLEAFEQLEVRTKEFIYLDWNPVSEFWFYTDVAKRSDAEMITLTYRDNEALDARIIASIEQRKDRPNWWAVYGEGRLGDAEGSIYRNWQIIDEVPHEARLERFGIDFGYTNDPTAIVALYKLNNGYIVDEVAYSTGMSNRQIADTLSLHDKALIIADSAEPKSIDELKSYGLNVAPSVKGPGSVNHGIQFVQDQRISVTKASTNIIKEYRNYLWAKDRSGKPLNEPESGMDHAMDSLRYALTSYKPTPILDTFIQAEPEMLYSDIGI